jgi:exopolyphosphatase/pppGpp-phosphohydrolase
VHAHRARAHETPPRSDAIATLKELFSRAVSDGEGDSVNLAAIDLGTNSFHLVVVRANRQGGFTVLDTFKEEVRLGSGAGSFNIITPDAEARGLDAVKRLASIAATRGAALRAVATSAVREARNREAFLRNVERETGVSVEVISGKEEARLIYLGVLQALPVYERAALCIDIGGGSTEIVVGRAGLPLFATSLKLGHIRLSELYGGADGFASLEQQEELRRSIRAALADAGVRESIAAVAASGQLPQPLGYDVAIGSSGTIEAVAAMAAAARQPAPASGLLGALTGGGAAPVAVGAALAPPEFTAAELRALVRRLSRARTPTERRAVPGLPERRARTALAGAVLLEELFAALSIDTMRVSPYALREGAIVDSLTRALPGFTPAVDIRRTSIAALALHFDTEGRHRSALHSATLAAQILAGLQAPAGDSGVSAPEAVREIDGEWALLLEAGVTLHSCGLFISHNKHHKHAHYLIRNSDILMGFSPLEIEVIACLARFHRKKLPVKDDAALTALPEEAARRLRVLVAIARVAIALDRRNTARAVASVSVLQDKDAIVLVVTPAQDAEDADADAEDVSLEIWAARQELPFFEKVMRRTSCIMEGSAAPPPDGDNNHAASSVLSS